MPQFNWTLLDAYDQKYEVGLFHAAKNGHLLVHCNDHIMLIDFNVNEDKEYHFYMGPELVNLSLTKDSKGNFSYGLVIDQKANTPLNNQRRIIEAKEKKQLYILAVGLIAAILILYLLIYKWF